MAGTIMFDWDSAIVTVAVPVHHTATQDVQTFELKICDFADLLAGHLKIEDGVISGCRDFAPVLAYQTDDPA